MRSLNLIPQFTRTEKFFKRYATAFSVLVLYMSLFGGIVIENKPSVLDRLSKNQYFKLLTLVGIAFTATRDIEISVIAALVFIVMIHVLRTDEERANATGVI